MKDIFVISKFTALETIKKKAFIISFVIMLSMIVIGFNIPNILKLFKTDISAQSEILIIDKDNVFQDKLTMLNEMDKNTKYKIKNKDYSEKEIQKLVENDYSASIYFYKDENELKSIYYVDKMNLEGYLYVDMDLINMIYQQIKLEEKGLSEKEISYINTPIMYDVKEFNKSSSEKEVGISVIISILLFFFIYYSSYQVSTAITTEKTSKIIDNLITSTKAKYIVIGKTLGIGLVGFTQLIIMILTAFISYKAFFPANLFASMFSGIIFNFKLIFTFLTFFTLGFLFYAFLFSLVGSFVNKVEELQSVNSVVSMLLFISYYLSVLMPTFQADSVTKILLYIPFTSPFMAPGSYLSSNVNLLTIISSVIILTLSIILMAYLSIRIYKKAILNYGIKLNIKELIRMYKEKN